MKCQLCEREFKANNALSIHLHYSHSISRKLYYDTYIKNSKDGICIFCGEKTNFSGHITQGYKIICNKPECVKKLRKKTNLEKYGVNYPSQNNNIKIKTKKTVDKKYGGYTLESDVLRKKVEKTNIDNFGVKNVFESDKIKNKIKQTNIEKYGVENISQSDKIKEKKKKTCLKNHGVEYGFFDLDKNKNTINTKYGVNHHLQDPSILQKQKNTNIEKYGVENISQSDKIKEKKKKTCLKNHGVEYPSQDPSIFNNIQKSSLSIRQFRNTSLWYQGSYELDFLEKYYDKFKDIRRSPSIKYQYKGKTKTYHPDFYIPSLNLIIEIKNSYLYNRDQKIINSKMKASEKMGYNILIIINKKYDELNEYIQSSGNKNSIQ